MNSLNQDLNDFTGFYFEAPRRDGAKDYFTTEITENTEKTLFILKNFLIRKPLTVSCEL
jgi:hypothetical protein